MNLRSCGEPGGGLTIDEYICGVLLSRHREGGESGPNQLYTGPGPKGHTIDIGQDSRLGFTPLGLAASDVLCGGVHETHDL